uniref:CRAL-TRIO domain-containing protein n=1 Tax=Meloidogyne hapla TaxID=6305 RepID=A0A1I8BBK6_MELHA
MSKFKESEILHRKVEHLLRPEELTTINLMRWLKSYNWEKLFPKIDDDFYKNFYDHTEIKHYCEVFQQSRLQYDWVNSLDNGLVFVEACPKSASITAQLIRTGQFLFAFFAWSEYMLRLILKRERETGQRSYAVCIFDMSGAGIWQYSNPMGPINRLFEVREYGYFGKILKDKRLG